jgi:hypothetical protein
MTTLMESSVPKARLMSEALKSVREAMRDDGFTEFVHEYVAGILPRWTSDEPLLKLARTMGTQLGTQVRVEVN